MVRETVPPPTNERGPPALIKSFEVVHIDESAVSSTSTSAEELAAALQTHFNVKLQIHRLEEVFETITTSLDRSSTNLLLHKTSSTPSPVENLHTLLAPLSPTSRTSLIASLRLLLLQKIAKESQTNLLFTAENSTDMAVKTLSGIAQGRGWGLGEDVAGAYKLSDGLSSFPSLIHSYGC